MTTKRLKTTAAPLPVPQNRLEAEAVLARLGAMSREITRARTRLDDGIAALKADFAAQTTPALAEMQALTDGLRIWAEANRMALTEGGKSKTVRITGGRLLWRLRPPAVRLSGGLDIIIARLRAMGLTQFLREHTEISKEALLAEPAIAASVPGVKIASAGEDFEAVPDETEETP